MMCKWSISMWNDAQHGYIGEMQIKGTVFYHYIPTRIARIKETDNTKCWWGVDLLVLSYAAAGSIKWHNHFGKKKEVLSCEYYFLTGHCLKIYTGLLIMMYLLILVECSLLARYSKKQSFKHSFWQPWHKYYHCPHLTDKGTEVNCGNFSNVLQVINGIWL